MTNTRILRPTPALLPGFRVALERGWSADNVRANAALPPHVLGHIGYAVVPWRQRRGHATLALLLPLAREQGLRSIEVTTDPDNVPSQKVITANGGALVEHFNRGEVDGHKAGLRFRIDLG